MNKTLALHLAIPIMLLSVSRAVVVSDGTPAYLDNSSTTRTLSVFSAGTVTSVIISIQFDKFDGETPGVNGGGTPFYNEISFSLTSPLGTEVVLIAENSFDAGGGGFSGTIYFDDAAAQVVNFDISTPYAGTFRPTDPDGLADFAGESITGDWTLTLADTVGADHLQYYSASLFINEAVPEPGSAMLGGVAALGLLRRRRNRA